MARTFPTAGVSPIDVYSTDTRPCGYFEHVVTLDSTERHNIEIASTPTFASGYSHVGLNIVETTAGTAGAWACGIYSKVLQGSTKNIDGYLCAGEFEMNNSTTNGSAASCLTLDWINNGNHTSTMAYIQLRDYGSTAQRCLFEFTDATIGADSDTTTLITANNPTAATHCIRFTVKNVPYWIMCVNTTGLTA